jgi:survival motor neuron protein
MSSGEERVFWDKSELLLESDNEVWDDRLLIEAYEKASKRVDSALAASASASASDLRVGEKGVQRSSSTSSKGSKKGKKKGKRGHESNAPKKWKVGQHCRCVFSEDGLEYEAQIIKIVDGSGLVRYTGYGNEELQELANLKASLGNKAREAQTREALEAQAVVDDQASSHVLQEQAASVPFQVSVATNSSMAPPPPPQPPHVPLMAHPKPRESSTRKRTPSATPHSMGTPPPPSFLAMAGPPPQEDEALASMLMSWYMSGYHTGYYRALKQFKAHCKCDDKE